MNDIELWSIERFRCPLKHKHEMDLKLRSVDWRVEKRFSYFGVLALLAYFVFSFLFF